MGLGCRDSGGFQAQEVWVPASSPKPTYWLIILDAGGGTV